MKIKLNINKNIFNSIYLEKGISNNVRTQIYYGGSSSGKSYFLAQRTILDILQGRNYLIVRQENVTIKKSVWNEIQKAISRLKLNDYFKINKSEQTITCIHNQKQILFSGLDDPEKIKSVTPINGVVTDIWIEEATQVSENSYNQLNKRLRGKTKFIKRVTLSFNPITKEHWIYKKFFLYNWDERKRWFENDNLTILKTTYKDNEHLTDDDVTALENESDKYYYEVYTLGNWGVIGNLIYTNWSIQDFDHSSFDNIRNGIDWGFGSDPFAFSRLHIDKKRKKIYIFEEIYATGLLDDEAIELVSKKINRGDLIVADSSEPKSIKYWRSKRMNVVKAKKGSGSIATGIKNLKKYEIIIHTRCRNTASEFSKYKWKENKAGEVLPIPIDKDNHILDELRYATENDIIDNYNRTTSKPAGF